MNIHPTGKLGPLPAGLQQKSLIHGSTREGKPGQRCRWRSELKTQQGTPVQFRSRENWFRLPFYEPPERAGHSLRFGEVASVHARECLSVCDAHTHFAPSNKLCPFKQVELLSCRPGPPALPATRHSQKPRDFPWPVGWPPS